MAHGPTYYPSRNCCIYCQATGVRLTDEHVVPYSLGGSHVLRGASCDACANITKKFEQKVARDLWGDARASYNAPSRRKKDRKPFVLVPDPSAPGSSMKVPTTEYPGGFVFYKMGLPGLLEGLPEDVDTSFLWTMEVISDDNRRDDFVAKNPGKLTMRFRHVPQEFGRLLAKIAYCQVLTGLDPTDFRPLCLPYIIGTKSNVSHIVGGSGRSPGPTASQGYVLETGTIQFSSVMLIVATVRLYSNTHAPEYLVVVGDVREPNEATRVQSRLDQM